MQTQSEATNKEIMATVLARDLVDGEWVEVGANLPVPRAGVLLAHLLWGPNMTVMIAMTKANVLNEPVIEEFQLITDQRATRWAEAYYLHNDLVENMKFRRKGVFFAGALQIDLYGNSNLIGIGADYRALKFRGPGAIGVCNATVMNSRFHLVVNSHDKRIFVPKCDFVSAYGWGTGGKDARTKLGLPGGGPRYVVTPLCVMDFEDEAKRMRLKSVHPGVTVEQVLANTGFELIVPAQVPVTEPPSAQQLAILRTRIDVKGALRADLNADLNTQRSIRAKESTMAHEWQTKISRVLDGKVIIHGYSHEQLIGDRSYAEGVFLTLRGELPSKGEARMMDAMLNSLLDHGFVAASVLAARYAASGNPQLVPGTAAGLLTAGSNTISPQHSAEFLDKAVKMMKDEKLSMEETAKRVVASIRAEKRRIPGLGHPTHKGDDFRAVKLRKIAAECGLVGDKVKMFEAIHAEFVRVTGRQGLCINVDGMLGALMSEMGFRPLQMAAVALLAVLPGIMAHVIEEIEEGKPLRIVRDEDCDYLGNPERPLP